MLQTLAALMVTAVLTAVGLPFVMSEIHSSRVSALESDIGKVERAVHDWGRSNGTYSGLSCPVLVQNGYWPANGCSGPNFLLPELPDTILSVTSPNSMMFQIEAQSSYYTPGDLSLVCNAWTPKSNGCTTGSGTLNVTFQ